MLVMKTHGDHFLGREEVAGSSPAILFVPPVPQSIDLNVEKKYNILR